LHGHLARPVERRREVLTVYQLHQHQILIRDFFRSVIQAGAVDVKQPALSRNWQRRVLALDGLAPLSEAHRPSACSKKSRSTLSWPICWCNLPTSCWSSGFLRLCSSPNISAAPSARAFFHLWIRLGWTPKRLDN